MNYTRVYQSIIGRARALSRSKKEAYFESHHIHPKSLGGSNKKENLVLLTPKEHFICHLLLTKMYPFGSQEYVKMCRAFVMLQTKNASQKRYTSVTYDKLKQKYYGTDGILTGKNSPFFGKTHTKESKQIISINQTKNNSMKDKTPWNYGLTKDTNEKISRSAIKSSKTKIESKIIPTDEHRRKISAALIGKKKPTRTQSHKDNISKARAKQVITEEHRRKMSESTKGIPKEQIQCDVCGKYGGKGAMNRWHFGNCKGRK